MKKKGLSLQNNLEWAWKEGERLTEQAYKTMEEMINKKFNDYLKKEKPCPELNTKTPHRCPICNGRGTVPRGFYGSTGTTCEPDIAIIVPENCKSCHGIGILWD